MRIPGQEEFLYGGECYPEQWNEEIFRKDLKWMKEANMNIATVGVFCWSLIQRDENSYDFSFLDRALEILEKEGFFVCLATPTAAPPLWMTRKYPEILAVDVNGHRRTPGGRANFCPNSEKYRRFAVNIAEKLAERYKSYKPLILWHVNNEYANYCYCEVCERKFREWLRKKYGSLEELNRCWYTQFWGQTIYDWEEITVPTARNLLLFRKDRFQSINPAIYQDYRRFMNESLLECFELEYQALKKHTPHVPVTTNLMATFKPLDYFLWARKMDVISWDSYPDYTEDHAKVSLRCALMRGAADGKPVLLMEQSPSQAIWKWYNHQKSESALRLHTFQTIAHGANGAHYFQIRQSRGGCERFHGAVITHANSNETRVFKAVKRVGQDLSRLEPEILDTRVHSQTAVLFDWNSWWALEDSPGPNIDFTYLQEVEKYYRVLLRMNTGVDILSVEQDFSKYRAVFAPALFMLNERTAKKIREYVEAGGVFVATTMSGIVNENNLAWLGGYLASLNDVFGVWIEEFDAFPPDEERKMAFMGKSYAVKLLEGLIKVEGANVLGTYVDGIYASQPCVTVNGYGSGTAYYIAVCASQEFCNDFVRYVIEQHGIETVCDEPSDGLEIVKRRSEEGRTYLFVMNFSKERKEICLKEGRWRDVLSGQLFSGKLVLDAEDVLVLERIER